MSAIVARLALSTSSEETATVISFRGEADVATLPVLVDTLARAIADHQGDVIIDMALITFIDTAAIRNLDRAAQFLNDHGRRLTLRSPSVVAVKVLDVFGLTSLIEVPPVIEGFGRDPQNPSVMA